MGDGSQFIYQLIYPISGQGRSHFADHNLRAPRSRARPSCQEQAILVAAGVVSLVQQPTEPSPEPVEGTPQETGRAAGAATRRPATTVIVAGGELPPSCPERLRSLWLYSAKTDSHPLPDPPVRGPPLLAASRPSPCAGVRLRRPWSGAAATHPQTGHE